MNYIKIAAISALMVIGSQSVIGQNYGDQAKQMGKEKAQEMKAKGQEKGKEKLGEIKEKGQEKITELKEKGQGKLDNAKAKGQDKLNGAKDNAVGNVAGGEGVGNGITAAVPSKLNKIKEMKFENKEGLSGAALGQARTQFAQQKADASLANIQGMNSKVSAGETKINAAQQRLDAAKALEGEDALSPEAIAEKQGKIDAARQKLNGFKSSVSSGMEKANAAKAGLSQLNPVSN